jgi:hypothetical protein
MTLNHSCPDRYGIEPACHWLSHNDGIPNPTEAWDAWVEACRPDVDRPWSNGAIMRVCRGLWASEQPFTVPWAYRYIIEGDGQEVSWLGSPLILEGAAATRVQGIGIVTDEDGATDAALKLYGSYAPGGHPADRNQIVDVQVIAKGQVSQGALVLEQCSDVVLDRSRVMSYSTIPSPTLSSTGQGGLHVTGHTEIHSYVPDADVISLDGASRFTMDSGLIGSNVEPGKTGARGRAYIGIAGSVRGIAITGTPLYSDNGNPPHHLLYQQPGSYLDGVRIGAETTIDARDSLFGGATLLGPFVDVQANWLGHPAPRRSSRTVRGRLYTGRDCLDYPAIGCVYGGHPGPRQTRVIFDPPFSDVPTITPAIEWYAGLSSAGVNIVQPDENGVTLETWPIDLECQFIAIGPV